MIIQAIGEMRFRSSIAIILVLAVTVLPLCMAMKGSIKTTRSDGIGNVHQYARGETVWIHGYNFAENIEFDLAIYKVNQPHKDAVMWTGHFNSGNGEFLIPTWTIPTDLESEYYMGEYKAEVMGSGKPKIKSDNFKILNFAIPAIPLGTIGASAIFLGGIMLFWVAKIRKAPLLRP